METTLVFLVPPWLSDSVQAKCSLAREDWSSTLLIQPVWPEILWKA